MDQLDNRFLHNKYNQIGRNQYQFNNLNKYIGNKMNEVKTAQNENRELEFHKKLYTTFHIKEYTQYDKVGRILLKNDKNLSNF